MTRILTLIALCLSLMVPSMEAGLFHRKPKPAKVKQAKYGVSRDSQRQRAEKAREKQMSNRAKMMKKKGKSAPTEVRAKASETN